MPLPLEATSQWVRKTVGHMPSVHISDYSDMYTQLAIQGPKAQATLQKLTPDTDLSVIKNYWFTWGKVCGLYNVMIARTGYTGEDGFEIYIPSDEPTSGRVWGEVLAAGAGSLHRALRPGSEEYTAVWSRRWQFRWSRDPGDNVFEAGLGRYAKLDKGSDFVGRDALLGVETAGGPKRKLVGLEMLERGTAMATSVCALRAAKRSATSPADRRRPS